tara:strand:+ start:15295 stop:15762 length:468 start_codon:yes stop_codon:yes gene_type:complete
VAGRPLTACLPPFLIIDFLVMDNRYYKQAGPDTPLYLSNGQRLVFPSVDGEYGYIATNDKFLIGEINTAINQFKGGVSVCTKDEYKDFIKKKSSGVRPERKWREEIKGGYATDSSMPPQFPEVAQPAASQESGSDSDLGAVEELTQRVGKFKATG